MVGDVFVKVREDQKQLKHSLPLLFIGFARILFEIVYDGKSVREQPFNVPGSHGAPFAAAIEGLVGAHERLVEKMVEAEPLVRQSGRNYFRALSPSTASRDGLVHRMPQSPEAHILEVLGAETTIIISHARKYPRALAKTGTHVSRAPLCAMDWANTKRLFDTPHGQW
jgi:hypothetical protein